MSALHLFFQTVFKFVVLGFAYLPLSFSIRDIDSCKPIWRLTSESKTEEMELYINLHGLEEVPPVSPTFVFLLPGDQIQVKRLANVDANTYAPESPLPMALFSDTNAMFSVRLSSDAGVILYESEWVAGGGLLQNGRRNCVCLSVPQEGHELSLRGFGMYHGKQGCDYSAYETQRIWLNALSAGEGSYLYQYPGVEYFDCGVWTICSMLCSEEGDNHLLYYCDVPAGLASLYFVNLAPIADGEYLVSDECYVSALSYGVCYARPYVQSPIIEQVVGADASTLALVVEAYLTYGTEESNGSVSGTIQNVFRTWFEFKGATTSELKNTMLFDYSGYFENGKSYAGLEKNESYSVYEKWNALCAQASINPDTGESLSISQSINFSFGGLPIYVCIIASFVCLSLELFSVLKRRRG